MAGEKKIPFFSIVMPVYNGAAYIEEALNSICSQTFPDWECLVIDDSSTDGTAEILEAFQEREERVRILKQEPNQGVSKARNKGIRHASGKYLWFVDADDRVEEDLLEILHRELEEHPAKLTVFGLIEEYYDAQNRLEYINPRKPKRGYYTEAGQLRKEILSLEQNTLYGYPWNKVYDLEYLHCLNLEFEDYRKTKFIEDVLFNIHYCMDIDTLLLLDITPYHYGKRSNGSLTNEYVPEYYKFHKRRIKELWEQQKYWGQDTKETKEVLGALYARYILSALTRNYDKKAKMSLREKVSFCRKIFRENLFMELVPYGKASDSRILALALKILNTKNAFLNICFSWGIYVVQTKLPVVYAKVKSKR